METNNETNNETNMFDELKELVLRYVLEDDYALALNYLSDIVLHVDDMKKDYEKLEAVKRDYLREKVELEMEVKRLTKLLDRELFPNNMEE